MKFFDFLNNFKIKGKLLLLVSFPLLALLYFSTHAVYNSYITGQNVQRAATLTFMATKISSLVHQTQKERGMTAGFLGSGGKEFASQLGNQREQTNKAYKNFLEFHKTIDYSVYPKKFYNKTQNAISMMDNIDQIRSKIDNLNIAASDAIGYYTKMNAKFLSLINASVKLNKVPEVIKDVAAFNAFLQAKERAGIERAVGANSLALDKFGPNMRAKFMNLISAQNSYLTTFKGYSGDEENEYFDKVMVGSDIDEVNRIRKLLIDENEIGGFNINPEYWFKTITTKIGLLKKTENYIRDHLRITDPKLKSATKVASALANLLHETQKERGATAGYIGSNGKKFVSILKQQRKLTDKKRSLLEQAVQKYQAQYKDSLMDKAIQHNIDNLDKLKSIRSKVSSLSISATDAISYYTNMNSGFLDTIALVVKSATNAQESQDLTAYFNFLMSKERAGIERAVMANSFARNKFLPGMKVKFTKLVTEQNAYINAFLSIANPKFVEFYKNTVKGKSVQEVERMRNIAFNATTIGGFNEDPKKWFYHMTKKIDKLKQIDDYLAKRLITRLEQLEEKADRAMYIDLMTAIFVHFAVWFISLVIASNILRNLKEFKKGLNFFFAYAVREKDYMKPMPVYGSDEFAQMTIEMNEGIEKTTYIIEQDKKVVKEIDDVMGKVANGFFTYTIHEKGATTEVESLRININDMLAQTKTKLINLNKILSNYGHGIYNYQLSKDEKIGMYGDFGNLTTGLVSLGHDVSSFMALFANSVDNLNKNTHILTSTASNLSDSSNTQAIALEQTAASIEEITKNITNNSKNVSKMSNLADQLHISSQDGQKLAAQTATSMEEINTQVGAINEAISIIDQIAFQTNILSLNAAVEAATAGEAGKGFAVVAQEVRNLANRSSEAAAEIKQLVESATQKANTGKQIAANMIDGYATLSGKIDETKLIIDDVAVASQEQSSRIVKINDAVSNIDNITQQNAQASKELEQISSQIASLSSNLTSVMSNVTFDEKTKQEVCDPVMTTLISSYKTDHIKFKTVNFDKIDKFESFKVTTDHTCKMGQWITKCEQENLPFTKTSQWSSLKEVHTQIHQSVQSYIDKNAMRVSNEELAVIAQDIEEQTVEVFNQLNEILRLHCEYSKTDQQLSIN